MQSDVQRPQMRRLAAFAGPVAIVAAVLVVLPEYLAGNVPLRGDVAFLWTPSFCFLGESLRDGIVPAWNPYILGGSPMAASPEPFGWLYLLPMTLFTALPCGPAISAMIVLQPIIAGLSCYAFLRVEGASRAAATFGGLVLALVLAGSKLVVSLPIAAAVALTMAVLAALAWFLTARRPMTRIVRAIVVALVFGQLVAAHMSVGAGMAAPLIMLYLLAKVIQSVTDGRFDIGYWARSAVLLGFAVIALNLALLVPRAAYVADSTLGLGYGGILALSDELSDSPVPSGGAHVTEGATAPEGWPAEYLTLPGSYVGAAAILLLGAALWSRRLRPVAVALSLYGLACYLLPLTIVAEQAGILPERLAEFYLHQPHRLGYNLLISIATLAGLGFMAWLEAPPRQRPLMLAPGALVLSTLLFARGDTRSVVIVLLAAAAAVVVLLAAARNRRLAPVLALVVGIELVVASAPFVLDSPPPGPIAPPHIATGHNAPLISTEDVLEPGPLARELLRQDGRYITTVADRNLGLALNGGNHLGIEHAGGYASAQTLRYWTFLRAATGKYLHYNRARLSKFPRADSVLVDLLDVSHVVHNVKRKSPAWADMVARQGDFGLYALDRPAQRASLLTDWEVVEGPEQALAAVTRGRFDPSRAAVLEQTPSFGDPTEQTGAPAVRFTWLNTQNARIDVTADKPSIVLVRNVFDARWRATVDGDPAEVLPTDYVAQGIAVPAGTHTVELRYDDPSLRVGLRLSLLSLAGLLLLAYSQRTQPLTRERMRQLLQRGQKHPKRAAGDGRDPERTAAPSSGSGR